MRLKGWVDEPLIVFLGQLLNARYAGSCIASERLRRCRSLWRAGIHVR